jgi:hypothetical protein
MKFDLELLAAVNAMVNIGMGVLMTYYEIKCYFAGIRIKLAYALIGVSWSIFYTYVLLNPGYDARYLGQTVVRPMLTLTMAILTIGAINRYKSKT